MDQQGGCQENYGPFTLFVTFFWQAPLNVTLNLKNIYFAAQHHYRLIVYNCGFCPGLMLASAEPEAMKSTAALVALKAIGDPSAFLELNSTTEYVDMFRDCTSLPLGAYYTKLSLKISLVLSSSLVQK